MKCLWTMKDADTVDSDMAHNDGRPYFDRVQSYRDAINQSLSIMEAALILHSSIQ